MQWSLYDFILLFTQKSVYQKAHYILYLIRAIFPNILLNAESTQNGKSRGIGFHSIAQIRLQVVKNTPV